MPRYKRMIIKEEPCLYHVVCRTVLPGLPFKDTDKDMLFSIIKRYSELYFIEILGFSLMCDHFHIVVRMLPEASLTDDEILRKVRNHYGETCDVSENRIAHYREKLSGLGSFMKEVKQAFTVSFNRKYGRKGTLWGERFKSVIMENGETLINCMAYVELNPVRAKLVGKPEDYLWNSMGYHVRTDNKGAFLSRGIGVRSFVKANKKEWLRLYLEFVHKAGAINDTKESGVEEIHKSVEQKIRKQDLKRTRTERFLSRNRYFTDSGIIGSKTFVSDKFQEFYDLFQNPGKRRPKRIQGLDGIYSLKRLTEKL